jgi:signal transduction histidine kinase
MKMTGRLEMSQFSLKNAIFNAFASVESRAAGKSIDLNYEIDSSVDEIYGEPLLIEETITNLLLNSIKYTPGKGAIKLVAADGGDDVIIEICDTGIGIPQDEIDKIFDEFYRASNARKVERDGTGLGLAIAKQVVERHGGRIWVVNNQTGGSTFSFVLPKTSSVKPVD